MLQTETFESPSLTLMAAVITQVIREQKTREKEAKEAELRELAMRARQERVGGAAVPLAARAADPYAVGGSQVSSPDFGYFYGYLLREEIVPYRLVQFATAGPDTRHRADPWLACEPVNAAALATAYTGALVLLAVGPVWQAAQLGCGSMSCVPRCTTSCRGALALQTASLTSLL